MLALGALALVLLSFVAAESAREEAKAARTEATLARGELAMSEADVERLHEAVVDFLGQAQGLQSQLTAAGPTISSALREALDGLETFATATIELNVPIRDSLSVDTTIELDRTLRVPVRATVPIDQTVETRITIDTPVGLDIPVDVRVPLQLELPIELTLDVPLRETIPINIDVPVELDVPVTLDVAGTELGELSDALRSGLSSLETLVTSLER